MLQSVIPLFRSLDPPLQSSPQYYYWSIHAYCIETFVLCTRPTYVFIVWKEDILLPAMFNPLCSSMNWQLFKKNFCNQRSHYENYGRFPLGIKAITCLPQNWHFSWWAKMNGTQRRTLVSPWKMHCMYSSMAKGHLSGWSKVRQR